MRIYLTRVVRSIVIEGVTTPLYNNLYVVFGQVTGRVIDENFAIYAWSVIEVDPRTGLEKEYSMNSLATTGDNVGEELGPIEETALLSFFDGVVAKMSEIVTTSPGTEIL